MTTRLARRIDADDAASIARIAVTRAIADDAEDIVEAAIAQAKLIIDNPITTCSDYAEKRQISATTAYITLADHRRRIPQGQRRALKARHRRKKEQLRKRGLQMALRARHRRMGI